MNRAFVSEKTTLQNSAKQPSGAYGSTMNGEKFSTAAEYASNFSLPSVFVSKAVKVGVWIHVYIKPTLSVLKCQGTGLSSIKD